MIFEFKNVVKEVNIDSNKKIVLFEDVSEDGNNIYCIDENENIVWKVSRDDKYTSEFVELNDDLFAWDYLGLKYKIDKENGKALKIGWDK